MATVGERKGAEIVIRCPSCGDSSDPNKGHFYINPVKAVGHCMKCDYSPKITPAQLFKIFQTYDFDLAITVEREDEELPQLSPGAGSDRYSALDRFHVVDDDILYDAFISRTPGNPDDIAGIYLRGPNKFSRMDGRKSLGWSGNRLVSSADDPIILVEGPYDVRSDRYVCVFGMITKSSLKYLTGHYVILMPDGDIWFDEKRRRSLITLAIESGYKFPGPAVTEVYYIKDGKDPDEAQNGDVRSFDRQKLVSLLR